MRWMMATVDMGALLKTIAEELVQRMTVELACERDEAKGALADMLAALGGMPFEDRTAAMHAAVARAKKVLGIEG